MNGGCLVRIVGILLAVALASGWSARLVAQSAAPTAAGVSMGHVHYQVRDVAANARFWTMLGGQAIEVPPPIAGSMTAGKTRTALRFATVLVVLEQGEPTGGTDGSTLAHVAFRVPRFADLEARGLAVQRLAQFPGVGFVSSPEGERIELFEDAALNLTFTRDDGQPHDQVTGRHSNPVGVPIAFHHAHLYVPAGAVADAKAWYARAFAGVPGKRSQYDAVDLPGINFNFSAAPKPTVPTKGRAVEHLGLEVRGLEAMCQRLAALGVTFEVPYTRAGGGAYARLVDPWGVGIELTEGAAP
jgi:catechol 2,3-dioxygenase-like lactoylglutathione lyase family enzyme